MFGGISTQTIKEFFVEVSRIAAEIQGVNRPKGLVTECLQGSLEDFLAKILQYFQNKCIQKFFEEILDES